MATVFVKDLPIVIGNPLAPGGFPSIDLNNEKIVNVGDPTNPKDAANKLYIDDAIGSITGALIFQGALDATGSGNQVENAQSGWFWIVDPGGTFLGASLNEGDLLICVTTVTGVPADLTDFTVVSDPAQKVLGPVSSIDGNLASFDGTAGTLIKDSGIPQSESLFNVAGTVDCRTAKLSNIVNGTAAQDAVSKSQLDSLQSNTVEGGIFSANGTQNYTPGNESSISWLVAASAGKQNPITNGGSSTTLSLARPGKYKINITFQLRDNNATVVPSSIIVVVDSNITTNVLFSSDLAINDPNTVGATSNRTVSFFLHTTDAEQNYTLRIKLTLLAASGSYDILPETIFEAIKYGT